MSLSKIIVPVEIAPLSPKTKAKLQSGGLDFPAMFQEQAAAGSAKAAEETLQYGKKSPGIGAPAPRDEMHKEKHASARASASRPGIASGDMDTYFEPKSGVDLDDPKNAIPMFLLPSAENIETLSKHAAEKLEKLLKVGSVSGPPSEIRFDTSGQMVLPADYGDAEKFKAVMKENPAMARELSTINALTSHYAGMQESIAFSQEYSAAKSPAAVRAVVAKYDKLFNGPQRYAEVSLEFSEDGTLSATADGKRVGGEKS